MGGILSCSVLYYSPGVEGDKQCFRWQVKDLFIPRSSRGGTCSERL